jgi:hypothetical protein
MVHNEERVTIVEDEALSIHSARNGVPWLACDLEVINVAEVMGLFMSARRTGRLEVVDPLGTRSLFFESGEFTGSSSTHGADRLGEVLWRNGKLSLDQVMIATEYLKENKVMIGRALIDLGFFEPGALRQALIDQAAHVFKAACLEERGFALFRSDQFHKSPLRFGAATRALVDEAIQQARELRELLRKLGSLDRVMDAVTPAPSGRLEEQPGAVLQLVTSAKKLEQTGRQLVQKASLGRVDGVRALVSLVDGGWLRPRVSAAEESLKVKRLCGAINLLMAALDEAGFGVGDTVREYVDSPGPAHEEALSGVSLATALDDAQVLEQAGFITGGVQAMSRALQAVLDDAVVQAKDTLPAELTDKVLARIKGLGL